jgi:hypothetical protein
VNSLPAIRVALAVFSLAVIGNSASAQGDTNRFGNLLPSTAGETSGMQDPHILPSLRASGNDEVLRHRDFAGEPCLAVTGFARRHADDPNLYDDVITVLNSCPQRIAMQVCYYESEECIPMDIPGGERKEAILGILPSVEDFRFEFHEKF